MALSNDLVKEFASLINNKTNESETPKNYTVWATAVVTDTGKFVQIDGSDYVTPISEVTDTQDGDRVLVEVKDHRAVVIGNYTAPPSLRETHVAIDKADQALQDLEDAKDAADAAKDAADAASKKAQEAIDLANKSLGESSDAEAIIQGAREDIAELQEEINAVKKDTNDIRNEVKENLETVTETMEADYAKKTDLVEVEGNLKMEISKNAGEISSIVSENFITRSELVKIEEQLNTKINQNSEEIALSASRVSSMETDTEEIKEQLRTAEAKVRNASQLASEAKDKANDAEMDLFHAQNKLTEAQDSLLEALEYYDTIVDKDDATEEEIAEAENAVREAELAVDQATMDVANAQAAADQALEEAAEAAANLEKAKEELKAVSSRIDTMEAQLTVQADKIEAAVTKVSEIDSNLNNNYYDKEYCDANFNITPEGITATVKKEVQTVAKEEGYIKKDEVGDMIEIGSRNMCLGTSSEWIDFDLGPEYVVIMRFKMEDLCTNFDLKDGDILTYSIYLKTNSGKSLVASWQKYNDDVDRVVEVSDDIIVSDVGRSICNPIIDTTYEYLDLMVTDLNETFTEYTVEAYRCLQLEKGNVPTEWNPAPEEMDERVDGVEDNLNGTNDKLDDVNTKLVTYESQIEQLATAISMLVVGDDGKSLLEQTDTGWTFNLSGIEENVKNNADSVAKLQELIGTLSTQTGALEDAVTNLQDTTEWIWMTTYGDEPCIALGESDTSYGLFITNTKIVFVDQTGDPTYISKDGLYTNKLKVGSEFQQRNYIWSVRANGNYGLMWKDVTYTDFQVYYNGKGAYIGTPIKDVAEDIIVKVVYSDGTSVNTREFEITNTTTNGQSIILGQNILSITYRGVSKTITIEGKAEDNGTSMGSATSCVAVSWLSSTTSALSVSYADKVEVVDSAVSLVSPTGTNFYQTTAPNYSKNNYDTLLGKYIEAFNGSIYYIDPESTYEHKVNPSQYVTENIIYNKAYEITVKE